MVLSCFDRRTRMMPFWLYDSWMFPAGARGVAGALHDAGFERTRAVFQLWNPRFRASEARWDGKPLEMLLLSSMQIHAQKAYDAIRDAWSMGDARPLIIAGGPKAFYQPYDFWPMRGPNGPVGPDVVVTGEQYVLLDLLDALSDFHRPGEPLRRAFERARHAGALAAVPGLVYLHPDASLEEPRLVDTGLQRLLQCFDEYPMESVALGLLEPPSMFRRGLASAPLADRKVRKHNYINSMVLTQGCKFNCSYCPIPALNQKSWRYRSPERIAEEFLQIHERFGQRYFFGADDNFFNQRETGQEILEALAKVESRGRRLGPQIIWGTEATQFDTYKNRDLLPLCRAAGLKAIWFGIEDLTAELVNKGQKPHVTEDLFKLMHEQEMAPMAMMMYHEGQPFYTPNKLYGLRNQVAFLRKVGAFSVQICDHTPAPGSREFEKTYSTGRVMKSLGDYRIPEAKIDGNHVYLKSSEPMWKRQINLLRGYATFYNPLSVLRALKPDLKTLDHWTWRMLYLLGGILGVAVTMLATFPYLLRLRYSKPKFYAQTPPITRVPVHLAEGAFFRFPPNPPIEPQGWELLDQEPLEKTASEVTSLSA